MKTSTANYMLLFLLLLFCGPAYTRTPLLVNGDFEQGDLTPDEWEFDGSYLNERGRHNSRCVRLDRFSTCTRELTGLIPGEQYFLRLFYFLDPLWVTGRIAVNTSTQSQTSYSSYNSHGWAYLNTSFEADSTGNCLLSIDFQPGDYPWGGYAIVDDVTLGGCKQETVTAAGSTSDIGTAYLNCNTLKYASEYWPKEGGFSFDESDLISGGPVTFKETLDMKATKWQWYFQSGEPSYSGEQNPVIRFNELGEQKVCLIAENDDSVLLVFKTVDITTPLPVIPGTFNANEYSAMKGVVPGDNDVGWIDDGDWMEYELFTGNKLYNTRFGVELDYHLVIEAASVPGGGILEFRSRENTLARMHIPATGGWQAWKTFRTSIPLAPGKGIYRIYAAEGGFNLKEIRIGSVLYVPRFNAIGQVPDFIDAACFSFREGVRVEESESRDTRYCDYNVGWIDEGDWMSYLYYAPAAGVYQIKYCVSSPDGQGLFRLDRDAGSEILDDSLSVPNTGGWQDFEDITSEITLEPGFHYLGIYAYEGGWNLRGFELNYRYRLKNAGKQNAIKAEKTTQSKVSVFPNPATDELFVSMPRAVSAGVCIFDLSGSKMLSLPKQEFLNTSIDVSSLPEGMYMLRIHTELETMVQKFIKK